MAIRGIPVASGFGGGYRDGKGDTAVGCEGIYHRVGYSHAAAALVVAVAVINVLYLVADCPLDLAPDEAHYWDWSRRPLDWSYYSKGPLVAWLIRGSCELFGTSMPAVRLPAVVCHALLLAAVYRLSAETFRNGRLALATVALSVTVPAITAPAVVMTIDGPFLACWAWACVFARRATAGGGAGDWIAAGGLTAVGILAKYTMVLFPACVGLYLLAAPERRGQLCRPGFWVMAAVAALGLVPVLVWNAGHEWVGLRHVVGHATGMTPAVDLGKPGGASAAVQFLLGQFGLMIGYWLVAWVAAAVTFRPGRVTDPGVAFLWWTSVPVWVVFAAFGVTATGQPNWPAAAYVGGFVLAVAWVASQVSAPCRAYRRMAVGLLAFAVGLGTSMISLARYPGVARPLLAELVGPPTAEQPTPVRKLDPTCRLAGWRTLAGVVDAVRARVRDEDGVEPLVATMVWTQPGELAFYCRGNPETFTFGLALADRHSQYDVWRPNPVADAQAFRGRTFVYVGDAIPDALEVFDRVAPPVEVVASDGGIPVAEWKVWVLRGFRGFPGGADGRGGAGH